MADDTNDTHPASTPLALLFTNAEGQVVFIHNNSPALIRCFAADVAKGVPLHAALGIDPPAARQFLQQTASARYIHDWPLTLHYANADIVHVWGSGVATYDDRGAFIGVDIALHEVAAAGLLESRATDHRDTLSTHIKQIQAQDMPAGSAALLQRYFTAQADALQVVLARMAGPRVCSTLEREITKLIARHGWAIQVQAGQFSFGQKVTDDSYRILLDEMTRYLSGIIGRRMVVAEMRAVDDQIDAQTRDTADQAGLRAMLAQA